MMIKGTPDLLLDQIALFRDILEKQKAKNPKAEAITFYQRHLEVLMLSYKYMIDAIRFVDENARLKDQIRWYSQDLKRLQDFETSVTTILTLQANGELDKMIEIANSLVLRNIDLKTPNQSIDGIRTD